VFLLSRRDVNDYFDLSEPFFPFARLGSGGIMECIGPVV